VPPPAWRSTSSWRRWGTSIIPRKPVNTLKNSQAPVLSFWRRRRKNSRPSCLQRRWKRSGGSRAIFVNKVRIVWFSFLSFFQEGFEILKILSKSSQNHLKIERLQQLRNHPYWSFFFFGISEEEVIPSEDVDISISFSFLEGGRRFDFSFFFFFLFFFSPLFSAQPWIPAWEPRG